MSNYILEITGGIFFSLTSQNLHLMISCENRGIQPNGSKMIKMVQPREHETGRRAMEKDEHRNKIDEFVATRKREVSQYVGRFVFVVIPYCWKLL